MPWPISPEHQPSVLAERTWQQGAERHTVGQKVQHPLCAGGHFLVVILQQQLQFILRQLLQLVTEAEYPPTLLLQLCTVRPRRRSYAIAAR